MGARMADARGKFPAAVAVRMSAFYDAPKLSPVWQNGRTDGASWYLLEDFSYESDLVGWVRVPALFITDFASIPREFWNMLPPWGPYGPAAIIHDWLYVTRPYPRATADLVLREAMAASGVDHPTLELIYKAVELFGQRAWDADAAARAAGDKRQYNPVLTYQLY